jgi:hypothetical protein
MKRHQEHETAKLNEIFIQIINRSTDAARKEVECVKKDIFEMKKDTQQVKIDTAEVKVLKE